MSADRAQFDATRSAAGGRNPWLIALVVSIATFMLVLDTSIANVAPRYIAGSMAAGVDESTWVITSYLVANAVVLPVSGWLAGVIGRKRFYMLCVALFTAASFLCGIAPSLGMLIFFRILQGLGDVRLVMQRQFGMSFLVMLAVGVVLFSTIQLLPQLLQTDYGYTAALSGLALMPGGMVMLFLMPIAGRVTNLVQPKYLIALGMLVTAAGLFYMTSLSGDADFSFFVWARSYQMIGLPFLFIPITTASYAGLPPDKTNEAAALINVARNEGGSIGVALGTTLLAQREQFHQSRLVDHTVQSSAQLQAMLQQAAHHFTSTGASLVDAQRQALGLVGRTIQTQAELLSYIDVYWVLAVLALAMIPVALLLRPVEKGVTTA